MKLKVGNTSEEAFPSACAGCGMALDESEIYACEECDAYWSMCGYDVERSRVDENPEPSEL